MNVSEWLSLIQTLILASTGGIIIWYTIETKKIRLETKRNNDLLAQQIQFNFDTQMNEAEPYFVSSSVPQIFSDKEINIVLNNQGETVEIEKILTINGITVSIINNRIEKGLGFDVRIRSTNVLIPDLLPISFEYRNKYNYPKKISYGFNKKTKEWKRQV